MIHSNLHLIGAAAKKAGISIDTARSYCRQGLLAPIRDSSGRRLFSDGEVLPMRKILLENMTRRRIESGMPGARR